MQIYVSIYLCVTYTYELNEKIIANKLADGNNSISEKMWRNRYILIVLTHLEHNFSREKF